jgi:predicted RNA-binding Zn-ribbon protein involved in translation (DUF1610 family)
MLMLKFICTACGHEWELPPALGGNQEICPACGREKVRRIDAGIRSRSEWPPDAGAQSEWFGRLGSAAGMIGGLSEDIGSRMDGGKKGRMARKAGV